MYMLTLPKKLSSIYYSYNCSKINVVSSDKAYLFIICLGECLHVQHALKNFNCVHKVSNITVITPLKYYTGCAKCICSGCYTRLFHLDIFN